MTRCITLIIISVLARICMLAGAYDSDSIKHMLSGRVLDDVEGVWQFPDDGASLLIVKASATTFDIILLDSPNYSIAPGTKIGKAVISAKKRSYDARLDKRKLSSDDVNQPNVVLTLTDTGMLQFNPYKKGYGISLSGYNTFRNLIPLLMRVNITKGKKPEGLTGAIRIYPYDKTSYKPAL